MIFTALRVPLGDHEISPFFTRPGPKPIVSDSEIIAMAIVGECLGWDQETELISNWHHHRDLFPNIPSRSRFNRRRRNLMFAINIIRVFRTSRLGLRKITKTQYKVLSCIVYNSRIVIIGLTDETLMILYKCEGCGWCHF